jgi:hypothetical protein
MIMMNDDAKIHVHVIRGDWTRVIIYGLIALAVLLFGLWTGNPFVVMLFFPFGYVTARHVDMVRSSSVLDLNEVERVSGLPVLRKNDVHDYALDTVDEDVLSAPRVDRSQDGLRRDAIARGDHTVLIKGKLGWITRDDAVKHADVAPAGYESGIGLGGFKEPAVRHTAKTSAADGSYMIIRPWRCRVDRRGIIRGLAVIKDDEVHLAKIVTEEDADGERTGRLVIDDHDHRAMVKMQTAYDRGELV